MTGQRNTTSSYTPPRERFHPKTRDVFSSTIAHIGLSREEMNHFYTQYEEIVREVGDANIEEAKEVDTAVMKKINSLSSEESCANYFGFLYNCKIGRNHAGISLVARRYGGIEKLPSLAQKFIQNSLRNVSCTKCVLELETHLTTRNLQCLKEPHITIMSSVSENLHDRKNLYHICELAPSEQAITRMLKQGETQKTIQEFLTSTYTLVRSGRPMKEKLEVKELENFFTLQAPESFDLLNKARCGVSLGDLTEELAYFARALTGFPLEIRPALYGEQAYFDGRKINLPTLVPYKRREDAHDFYRATTAHQAGQVEFGTFDILLENLIDVKISLEERYGKK